MNNLCFLVILIILVIVSGNSACSANSAAHQATGDNRSANLVVSTPEEESESVFPVNAQQAIVAVARFLNLDATKQTRLIACDAGFTFSIVYLDAKTDVFVSKSGGQVLVTRPILPNVPIDEQIVGGYADAREPENAVRIAREHFRNYAVRVYNTEGDEISQHVGEPCDLGNEWRVFFVPEELKKIRNRSDIARLPRPNDHPPDYIIDKSTGRILYFSDYGPSGSEVRTIQTQEKRLKKRRSY